MALMDSMVPFLWGWWLASCKTSWAMGVVGWRGFEVMAGQMGAHEHFEVSSDEELASHGGRL
jgi:hypothetical protein